MENIRVKDISQKDTRTLEITWSDSRCVTYDVVELRRMCPCAVCVDEWTLERRLEPSTISDDVRPIRIDSIGRYALSIQFTDGHKTGIYTFPYLRATASANIS